MTDERTDRTGKPAPHEAPDADAQLVERTLLGDTAAFELLVIKYQRRVQRLVARLVRHTDLIPDITQETFISAFRALHQFRGEAQFYTWLYRIAVNTAKKHLLAMKNDPVRLLSEMASEDDEDEGTFLRWAEPSSDETPESALAAKELALAVNQALENLPEDWKQALVLREFNGLSYDEIAQQMNWPAGTVRSRIFRAREAISERIKPMLERQSGKRW